LTERFPISIITTSLIDPGSTSAILFFMRASKDRYSYPLIRDCKTGILLDPHPIINPTASPITAPMIIRFKMSDMKLNKLDEGLKEGENWDYTQIT
jgi:hypothetical protein